MSAIFHAGISGYRGRMGRAVSQVLDAREDVVVAARFDWGETADLSLCDVIIDFSTPDASVVLAEKAAENGGPALVIGSTGFTPEQEAALLKAAEKVAIVKSGNFSLGVNILIGLVQHAAQRLDARDWDIEITEAHHRRKVDSPSGTALMLGEAAAEGRFSDLAELRTAPYDGVQGEREPGKIGFSSIRAGGIVGEHTVLFASEDEVLTLSHSAIDRSLFARGAVAASAWVRTRQPGLYDMQDVLGFRQA
ncbi:MAG: 4-hydroxy-tetrahydrodipicolinate reductase [Candidatus Brevundimonas colombiensis]|uniref:4-hydroxy-tetrahydrodipicolinate reductase n=1 Tax=Candidatus Brevundimonas colombiensis TaxID=3121376 RepID=A0AAJ6BKE3_9CAUL|nr:4-hydroxy-tetrahydrodipicolinate reductase [Brevundimonas sp.]WEK40820.1 MAG: 4-hydroxy-tetrahydrodipicolinate reductase [Brevundimonas sp.]